jgi:hypothetical protein
MIAHRHPVGKIRRRSDTGKIMGLPKGSPGIGPDNGFQPG